MKGTRVQQLFQLYMQNSISEAEKIEFLNYVYDPVYEEDIKLLLGLAAEEEISVPELELSTQDRILNHIFLQDKAPKKNLLKLSWLKYAAALLIAGFAGMYVYNYGRQNWSGMAKTNKYKGKDIAPGKNKATLILANGSTINLDDAKEGEITKQAGFSVTKNRKGELVYTAVPDLYNLKANNALNTIITPRGGQYQVILPDGTKVWLNAASSLKYPAVFTGTQRKVELSGEAYFEVSKDKHRPFIVKTSKQQVEVLGTHFNISSYADEPETKTDLFEGSVRVTAGEGTMHQTEVLLKPAQQAVLLNHRISIQPSAGNEALAWKDGYFLFEKESIESIMKKVARWYDVEVEYRGDVRSETFKGKVSRYEHISELLSVLERTETIHFDIKGRKIIVLP